jgi:hypothetical protein
MWTNENRGRFDRSKLRYPSDLTDEELALIAPVIPPAKREGGKRTVSVRDVVNGLIYVLSTGLPVARDAEGSATSQHGEWRLRPLGLRRHAGSHPSCSLREMPRAGRTRSKPNRRDH